MGSGDLTIRDAAQACGVSESTIRRRIPKFAGAHRDTANAGQWLIPTTSLTECGFDLDLERLASLAPERRQAERRQIVVDLANEVDLLTNEVDELERANAKLAKQNRELTERATTSESLRMQHEATIAELKRALALAKEQADSMVNNQDDTNINVTPTNDGVVPDREQRLNAARQALRRVGKDRS